VTSRSAAVPCGGARATTAAEVFCSAAVVSGTVVSEPDSRRCPSGSLPAPAAIQKVSVVPHSVAAMENSLGSATVQEWVTTLATLSRDVSDIERIDLLRSLEELKGAAAAAQARASADFDLSQREEQRDAGEPRSRIGRGIAEQVALARRDSPVRGGRHLGLAKALVHEMPHTLTALTLGRISEWRASLLVRETAYLDLAHRAAIDEELAGPQRLDALTRMGDRELVDAVKRIAYRLDPHAVTKRARRAEGERTVTLRPAPDTMSYLTALLPVAHGVACLASLNQSAAAARAAGDPRSKGQVMADALVAALTDPHPSSNPGDHAGSNPGTSTGNHPGGTDCGATGHADVGSAGSGAAGSGAAGSGVAGSGAAGSGAAGSGAAGSGEGAVKAISLQLVMTDRTLFARDHEPAYLVGYGTVPAGWARDLIREAAAQVWLRRLYTHPGTGDLLAADARARLFTGANREVLIGRDRVCRTPWCDAPIRHGDHPTGKKDGGETSLDNGQGLCEQCNYAKEALGWRAHATSPPGDRHTVTVTTPTGHRYHSRAPAPPGSPLTPSTAGLVEYYFSQLVLAG
jgi:hypothetical protein